MARKRRHAGKSARQKQMRNDGSNEVAQNLEALKLDATSSLPSTPLAIPAPAPTNLVQALGHASSETAIALATPSSTKVRTSASDSVTPCQLEVGKVSHPTATKPAAASTPTRVNFPLPRELRDQIYGYLLHNEYAKDGMTYRFHTNIMAVNHAVNDEAEEYLYKNNTFVIFSYSWRNNTPLNLGLVPSVTNKNVGRMKQHSMRVHSAFVELGQKPAAAKSMLLLAHDMDSMCRAVQLPLFPPTDGAGHVSFPPPGMVKLHIPSPQIVKSSSSALVELRETKYRKMSVALQHKLLLPLHGLVSNAQKVKFLGAVADTVDMENTRNIMSPTLVCTEAKKWAFHSNISAHKTDIDALVVDNKYEAAAKGYYWLKPWMKSKLFLTFLPTDKHIVSDADLAMDALNLDICISGAWLALRRGDLGEVADYLNHTAATHYISMHKRENVSAYRHLILLARVYLAPEDANIPNGLSSVMFGQALRDLKTEFPQDTYISNDRDTHQHAVNAMLAIGPGLAPHATVKDLYAMGEFFNTCGNKPAQDALPLGMCSAKLLKPRIYNSGSELPKKPDSVVGWQDLVQLDSLSVEEIIDIRKTLAR